MRKVAALFVEPGGCYSQVSESVEIWDRTRDARRYNGPWPIVAHPPCDRWGRFWHGAPIQPHKFELGDDNGCFAFALAAIRRWGGVIEHPAHSAAWKYFRIPHPAIEGGWLITSEGWTCHVEQGHYGHFARKPTWLLVSSSPRPAELIWGRAPQRLPQWALERYGYAKARRIGVVASVGGKHKKTIRAATPAAFRDLLITLAASSVPVRERGAA